MLRIKYAGGDKNIDDQWGHIFGIKKTCFRKNVLSNPFRKVSCMQYRNTGPRSTHFLCEISWFLKSRVLRSLNFQWWWHKFGGPEQVCAIYYTFVHNTLLRILLNLVGHAHLGPIFVLAQIVATWWVQSGDISKSVLFMLCGYYQVQQLNKSYVISYVTPTTFFFLCASSAGF